MNNSIDIQTHIMVVEDNPNIADALQHLLNCNGYQVTAVGTGAAALQTAAHTNLDLVVLDISLPDIDGWTVFSRLQSKKTIPVICLTSMSLPRDFARAKDLGIEHYLIKPRGIVELPDTIRQVLNC